MGRARVPAVRLPNGRHVMRRAILALLAVLALATVYRRAVRRRPADCPLPRI